MARHILWLCLVGSLAIGCQSSSEKTVAEKATDDDAPLSANTSSAPATLAPETTSTTAQVAEFQPPFPGRTELFTPPRGVQPVARRADLHGESVELKGFVNVDGPRVVLSINGVLSPIPVGGEERGVQVISINPPQAVLQRGRSRWTASLE